MATRTCALDDCGVEFEPKLDNQIHCCRKHATLHRVRRLRARRRNNGGGGGNGGPPNGGLVATIGGAVEYGTDGSFADNSKYYVKYDSVRQAFRLLVADDATLQIHQSVD
jgi:hypothetical protein